MITLTDNQIKELTGQALAIPKTIDDLQKKRTKLVSVKQDWKDLDDANSAYSNYYYNVLAAYNSELQYLNGTARTLPNLSLIDAAARLTSGTPYFIPGYVPLIPIVQPTDQGTADTPYAATEPSKYAAVSTLVNLLEVGFEQSPPATHASTTVTASGIGYISVTSVANLVVGQTIIAFDSATSNYCYGVIDSFDTLDVNITTSIGDTSTITSGGTLQNYHPGFTLPQRESNTGLSPGEIAYITVLESQIDAAVSAWKTALTLEHGSVFTNPANGSEYTQLQTALAAINTATSTITSWQALSPSGVSGRYGTNLDTMIVGQITARTTFVPTRITQVTTATGTLTQPGPNGAFSGSGNYLKAFTTLNMRIHKSKGTLRNYYAIDAAIINTDQNIAMSQSMLTRETQNFDIKQFSADANASDSVKLKDVAGLSPSQAVKIITNTKAVITTTIVSINDLTVQLAASIPADYIVADKARLVRQLQ